MPQAIASITIKGDIDQIFTISNDIARWPELFAEYSEAKILSFEQYERFARIDFQLTNAQGESWRSWRILDYKEHVAIAQRGAPMFPFAYMHLTWTYQTNEEGVVMTWIQDFDVDPKAPLTAEQVLANMTNHMQKNQVRFKDILEQLSQA